MAEAAAGPSTEPILATPQAAARWDARWRWLALAGAALAFYAVWAPWAIANLPLPLSAPLITGPSASPNLSPSSLAGYQGGTLAASLLAPAFLAWLTPLGLLFVPFLWSRRFRPLAAGLFALWWLVMTLVLLVAAVVIVPLLASGQALVTLNNTTPRVGMLVALVGLVAGWAALVPLVRDALGQTRGQARDQGLSAALPRAPRRVVPGEDAATVVRAHAGLISGGAGALTTGVVLWGVSLLVLPWALGSCPANTPTAGHCPGLSAAGAMAAAMGPAIAWIDPQVFLVALPVLLLGGAVLSVAAAWRLPVNARLCGWLAAWLAVASGAVALGVVGQAEVVAGLANANLAAPSQYAGFVLGEVGLAFGWLALVPLILAAMTQRRMEPAAA